MDYPHPFTEYEFREGNGASEFLVAGSFEARYSPQYTTSKYPTQPVQQETYSRAD